MEHFPHSLIFFVQFIILTGFAVLKLFISTIVGVIQMAQKETRQVDKSEIKEFKRDELDSLRKHFDELHSQPHEACVSKSIDDKSLLIASIPQCETREEIRDHMGAIASIFLGTVQIRVTSDLGSPYKPMQLLKINGLS